MLTFANAKINLGLNITERRPDGYHNLETVFYPVRLFDAVEITAAAETSCELNGLAVPGRLEDNICLKAYRLLKDDFGLPPLKISLLKNIPVGAGLGGGSADAAFLLKLLNEQFGLQLSEERLEGYARILGADCAFFIRNKPVCAFGRGDQFSPVEISLASKFLVVVKPPVHVSTADAFGGLKPVRPIRPVREIIQLPLREWRANLRNDFEETIFSKYPEIAAVKQELYHAGATFALMSGSGSSVFAIFDAAVTLPELERRNAVFYNV